MMCAEKKRRFRAEAPFLYFPFDVCAARSVGDGLETAAARLRVSSISRRILSALARSSGADLVSLVQRSF